MVVFSNRYIRHAIEHLMEIHMKKYHQQVGARKTDWQPWTPLAAVAARGPVPTAATPPAGPRPRSTAIAGHRSGPAAIAIIGARPGSPIAASAVTGSRARSGTVPSAAPVTAVASGAVSTPTAASIVGVLELATISSIAPAADVVVAQTLSPSAVHLGVAARVAASPPSARTLAVGDLCGHGAPRNLLSLETLYSSPSIIGRLHGNKSKAERPRVETVRGQTNLLHSPKLGAHILEIALLGLRSGAKRK